MTKRKLVILALLSVFLVSAPQAPQVESWDSELGWTKSQAPESPTVIDANSIARIMQNANPLLSSGEGLRIGAAVMRYSQEYNLNPELVSAVILVESGARPWVESPKGALGLMQVMPYMRTQMAREGKNMAGNLMTIETNIEAGCWILADNIRRLGEENGVSSYFWGSEIRSVSYLNKVRLAQSKVRAHHLEF